MSGIYVNFDQAIRLKEIGFDWHCRHYFIESRWERKSQFPSRRKHPRQYKFYRQQIDAPPKVRSERADDDFIKNSNLASRQDCRCYYAPIAEHFRYATMPRLDQAAKWLREVAGIAINVTAHDGDFYMWEEVYLSNAPESNGLIIIGDLNQYATYEEALSKGISEVLDYLLTLKFKA